ADDGHERADGLTRVGIDEPLAMSRRRANHPRVAPAACAAKERRLRNPQRAQRVCQLEDPVAAQLVRRIDSQLPVTLADHLALFAERAGDHLHFGATSDVMGNRRTGRQRLVVRMRVYEQQPWGHLRQHDSPRYRWRCGGLRSARLSLLTAPDDVAEAACRSTRCPTKLAQTRLINVFVS